MRERASLAVLVAVSLVACEERPPPLPVVDAGPRDAGTEVGMDASARDAAIFDAAVTDAAVFDARVRQPDAAADGGLTGATEAGLIVLDAAASDAGPEPIPDAAPDGGCTLPDGTFDACGCGAPVCDDDDDCAEGLACADDPGCGVRRCGPAGAPCTSSADCAAGSACLSGPITKYCARPDGGCHDPRDCPDGYACEGGACVDRRVACATGADCPLGFFCDAAASGGAPFCSRLARRCAGDHQCPALARCRDVDGDAESECVGLGTCETNADCAAAGEVCGTSPELAASCGAYGACASDVDCGPSQSCRDLWGDGARACVQNGGCVSTAACADGVCASLGPAEVPRCIGEALP